MKRKESRNDRRIRELMGQLLDYELSRLPDEETLQEAYRLSDLFHHKMAALIRSLRDIPGHSGTRK